MEHTFETPGPVRLRITIGAGQVHVEMAETERTEIDLVAMNRAAEEAIGLMIVRAEERGGRWDVAVEEQKRGGFLSGLLNTAEIGVRVRCPRLAEVETTTGSADVEVRGVAGSIRAKTGSGDLSFDDVAGELVANSASGDVTAGDVGGDCTVKTASGDARVAGVGGAFLGNLVSGDLQLGDARGPVTVSTVSGDTHVGSITAADVRIQAVSGDVRVGVRPGLRLWIDATSVSGDMTSELEPSDGPPVGEGPLIQLRAKTVSGDVEIVRAA